jgi:predicted dehydrogenase
MLQKIAVVGAGQWGKNIIRQLHEFGALAGVLEIDPKNADFVKKTYPEIHLYKNFVELLETDIPAVVISTPAPTHFELARQALLAGKDVFVEKPLVLKGQEAEDLVSLAEKNGHMLMVGHLLLYQPAIQKLKSFIDEGGLGDLLFVHQERLNFGKIRKAENVLWSFGVHDLAVQLYLIGSEPVNIKSVGQCSLQPTIEDEVFLHLEYPNGIHSHLHVSWFWPEKSRKLIVGGTKGMIVYDELKQSVVFHRKTVTQSLELSDLGEEILIKGDSSPLALELKNFIDCLSSRQKPIADGKNGAAVVKILDKISKL